MTRRALIAGLWLTALWWWGSLLHGLVGIPDNLGLVAGIVVAAGIMVLPRRALSTLAPATKPSLPATTRTSSSPS